MEKRHSKAVLSLVGSICADALRHEPDQKLLQLFGAHHDQHAFRALVEKHQGSVLALARSIVRNEEDAEDVMQAVFLVLARKLKQAEQANSLTSWLLGVTYRTAKHAQRQYARRQRLERRVPLDESIPDRNGSAENKAELSDLVALLHVELAKLPKKYREPFILCHHDALSRAEAAKKLGYAIPTLDRRLARMLLVFHRTCGSIVHTLDFQFKGIKTNQAAHDPLCLSALSKETQGSRTFGRQDDFLPKVQPISGGSSASSVVRSKLAGQSRHLPNPPARGRPCQP